MSHHVSSWAWQQDVSNPRQKLLLVKLADSSNDDGVCWPSMRTLARDTGMSKSAIDRNVAELVKNGYLEIVKRRREDGGNSSNLYRLNLSRTPPVPPERDTPPCPAQAGHPVPARRDTLSRSGGTHEPSLNRQVTIPAAAEVGSFPLREADGDPVSPGEASLSLALLAYFNEVAGTRFRSGEYLRGIVLRLREFPEVAEEEHRRLIKRVLSLKGRDRWWKDPAPNIIYGNSRAFDRAVHNLRRSGNTGGDDAEGDDYGGETPLGPDGEYDRR